MQIHVDLPRLPSRRFSPAFLVRSPSSPSLLDYSGLTETDPSLFIDPSLLPQTTSSLPLAPLTLPHAGNQGARPPYDKKYMPWASLVGLVAHPSHQAPGVLKDQWAENLSTNGWKLRGLTPFLLGWEAPDTLGRGGEGDETEFPHVLSAYATLLVKVS